MSWLSEILHPQHTAREASLLARIDTAKATADAALGNQQRMAADLDEREQRLLQQAAVIRDLRARLDGRPSVTGTALRLERAIRACAGYRAELANQSRLIRNQQRQLDQLHGLNTPPVLAGAHWQQPRSDKPKEHSA